ncbi:MAG: hypothetical protein ACOC5T_09780 [Elusimicrobiota bacterium]
MAIKSGESANADEVMGTLGKMFKNQSQLIYNSDYIGWSSDIYGATGTPDLENTKYDVFSSDSATTKTNFIYDSEKKEYAISVNDRASSDSTHDPDSFTNPSNAFDNDDSTYASGGGKSALGKTFSEATIIEGNFKASYEFVYTGGGIISFSMNITLQEYDGSSWNNVKNIASESWSNVSNGTYTISVDVKAEEVNVTTQGLRLSFNDNAPSGSRDARAYTIEYGEEYKSGGTLIFQNTGLDTITDCIPVWNSDIDASNTLAVSISADGTNYESVTEKEIHRFTNNGTNLYIKFEITNTDTSTTDTISEYAIWYNTGAE